MNIRESLEQWEKEYLSPYAALSMNSKGRLKEEEPCDIRPVFQRDRDRILHSKSFRRLKDKTQVFLTPEGDHYRTRLTHTLEVSQNARTIAKALQLNEDLVEAIALGHDLGHTPFGHSGERALDQINPKGFKHYEQSLRVIDVLEKDGNGMNLTYEVRDGILNHSGTNVASTEEGKVIKYADRFAYINHDIDDALRAGVISFGDIPAKLTASLGSSHSARINTMITDIVSATEKNGIVCMSSTIEDDMMALRQFMFDAVYKKLAVGDHQSFMVIEKLYKYFRANLSRLPEEYEKLLLNWDADTVVCDYISGMTDNYCVKIFEDLFMPIPRY